MKLNSNRNIVLFFGGALSLAVLFLIALGLKLGRAQATENQGARKFSGLLGQTVSVEQAGHCSRGAQSRLQPRDCAARCSNIEMGS